MVEYYNLSSLGGGDGYVGFMQQMSVLTGDLTAIVLLVLVFIVPLIFSLRRGEDLTKSVHLSALYTSLLSIFMYIAQWIHHSQIIYICIMIYVVSASIRWYHRE